MGNSLSGGLGARGSTSGPLDDLDFALGLRASGGIGVSAALAGGGASNKVRVCSGILYYEYLRPAYLAEMLQVQVT